MRLRHGLGSLQTWFCIASLTLCAGTSTIGQEKQRPAENRTKTKKRKNPAGAKPFVLVGAGDIASCKDLSGAEATAKLIDKIPGEVFAAGDLAYEKGTAAEFANCYD